VIFVLNQRSTNSVNIGIIEPFVHIAVSDITKGIKDGLDLQKDIKFQITVKNANGDSSVIPQIIAQYKDAGVRVFVPIFTSTAQATKSAVTSTPIVFAAVTDPKTAGLINDINSPEGNITGVSDLWPIGMQFELIRQILPTAKQIGILFDPNDPSSAATMPMIRNQAEKNGFILFEKPVHSPTEMAEALPIFKGKIDCFFTANDVTVTKAFPAMVAYSIENKIPLFAGDYSSVQRGAIAAIGQNYYNVGREAAKLIIVVISGSNFRKLPVIFIQGGDLHLNMAAAEKMGVVIPDNIRKEAKEIYTTISEVDPK
jgi:putative ABC transport system substrate-binding protein